MPVQRTIFGRPIRPRQMNQLKVTMVFLTIVVLVYMLPSSTPELPSSSMPKPNTMERVESAFKKIPKIPKMSQLSSKIPSASILNPFAPVAHPPAIQENSSSGDSSWYSDWKWLSPFSSSVTLDENRSILPPLSERPPIYTYYDYTLKKEKTVKKAEHEILLTWRKAWWAQGFKPIILGPAEAMKNPQYVMVQGLELEGPIQTSVLRWLAWEGMGNGILCDYKALPMGAYDDTFLSFLRRQDFAQLRRFKNLGSGLFSGPLSEISAAIKLALESPKLKDAKSIIEAVPDKTFKVDSKPEAIAFYDAEIVAEKYATVASEITTEGTASKGLTLLAVLMNAHLHNTWQNIFSSGISVLKPVQQHMTAIVEPAYQLANLLTSCPASPIPTSCPPNRPNCKPCISNTPLKVNTLRCFRNTSSLYTIGAVPHPYSLALLSSKKEQMDIPFIRRETIRDQWLAMATVELLGTGVSNAPRIVKFKEAVASDYGVSHSLWFAAEKPMPQDLDWHFGFVLPSDTSDGNINPKPEPDDLDGPIASPAEVMQERRLLDQAKVFGKSLNENDIQLREATEKWNLADMEAWRFAKAFRARSSLERLKWEEEEKKYSGGAGAERPKRKGEGKSWAGRWTD